LENFYSHGFVKFLKPWLCVNLQSHGFILLCM